MTPTKQTVLHDPENGKIGNCLSAVLASLLHMPIEDVPVFYAPSPIWQKELNSWLRQFGLAYLQVADFDQWCSSIGIEGCYSEIGGSTTRSHDVAHAVVGKDGSPIFDPHPDNSGLSSIESSGIFLALRPWETARAATECEDDSSGAGRAARRCGIGRQDSVLPVPRRSTESGKEMKLEDAQRLLGHSKEQMTKAVYRRVGEMVRPTK